VITASQSQIMGVERPEHAFAGDRPKPIEQPTRQPQLMMVNCAPSAAPRPTAPAMGDVPASNRRGGALNVALVSDTSAIICPPARKGGMVSSSSARPHSTPIPVGP